jgi:hypothetical protein
VFASTAVDGVAGLVKDIDFRNEIAFRYAASARPHIMNATAIVACGTSSVSKKKRESSTHRTRIDAAKKAKGIGTKTTVLPWSVCDRKEKETGVDQDGNWTLENAISRQRALLKAGGGSAVVQEALKKNAQDVARFRQVRTTKT